jgi:hypothetical protein
MASSWRASSSVKAAGWSLSMSKTAISSPAAFRTGRTISDRVEEEQAMWPGKASTSGTSWIWPVRAAGAADAAVEGDDEAAVAALVGADLEKARFGYAVEAGPVEAGVGVVHLAGDGGHEGDGVGFAFGEGGDGLGEGPVIGHVGLRGGGAGGLSAPRTPRGYLRVDGG